MSTRRYRRDPQQRAGPRPIPGSRGRYTIEEFAPGAAPPAYEAWLARKEAQIAAGEVFTGRSQAAADRLVAALVQGSPVEVNEDTWLEFIQMGTPGPIPRQALLRYFEALDKPATPRRLVAGVPRVVFGVGNGPSGARLYAWAEEESLGEKIAAHRFMLQEVPQAEEAGAETWPHDLLVVAPVLFDPPACARCGRYSEALVEKAAGRQRFREMTGLRWPGGLVGIPLAKDRRTLGLPLAGLPETVKVCLPCIIAHMEKFNALNAARQPVPPQEVTEE